MIVEEIPLDQPVDVNEVNLPNDILEEQDDPQEQQELGNFNQQLNVGMVLMPEMQFGLVFREWEARKKADETIKFWENFVGQGNFDNTFVRIPLGWFHFFSSLLLPPDCFGWTKKFLASGASGFLAEHIGNLSMPIPKTCPTNSTAVYVSEIMDDALTEGLGKREKSGEGGKNAQDLEASTQQTLSPRKVEAKKRKTCKSSTLVVDSQVCRSDRIKQGNNGFKSTDCSSKKCTAYNASTLSTKVINPGCSALQYEP